MEGFVMKEASLPSGEKPIGQGPFPFDCHPQIDCFAVCCKDVDMYLYPYDILRMKNNLGIVSDKFLEKHTFSAVRDNPFFPSVMLKMTDQPQKPCPFLTAGGCGIYEDRPSSCRTYPLERGVARGLEHGSREDFYFLKRAPHCLGHQEKKEWAVEEWIADQQIEPYNKMNDLWVDIDTIFRTNPWGKGVAADKKLRMAFMACFNVDHFRNFILNSSFLSRLDLSKDHIEKMTKDDTEAMKFGFKWVKFFLTGQPILA